MTTPTKIEYGETYVFLKDLKRLLKRFRTLGEDLETATRNAIELSYLKHIDSRSVFPIPDFCDEEIQMCEIKTFSCKALKGRGVRSGIRVIYAFYPATVGEKENEDCEQMKEYLKNHKPIHRPH